MVSAYLYSDLVLWWYELSFYGHAICDMYPNKVQLDPSLILNKTEKLLQAKIHYFNLICSTKFVSQEI